ncbi:hypothetical protein J6590_033798 [Homalodisca vitripennis]|nr:hypothetical protein J6590_033798 [Homalodisca vitripennis]
MSGSCRPIKAQGRTVCSVLESVTSPVAVLHLAKTPASDSASVITDILGNDRASPPDVASPTLYLSCSSCIE